MGARIGRVETSVVYPVAGRFKFFERPAGLPPGRPTVAVVSLAEIGRPALNRLKDALFGLGETRRRVKAAEVLGAIARADRTALLALLDVLREEPDAAVRDAALGALAGPGVVLRSPWPRRPGHPSLPRWALAARQRFRAPPFCFSRCCRPSTVRCAFWQAEAIFARAPPTSFSNRPSSSSSSAFTSAWKSPRGTFAHTPS
jgi:hypothetical protein